MMRVTFLGHSGFLMESESVCLLFDWSEGELPPLPEKPLFVFASHRHQDHPSRECRSFQRAANCRIGKHGPNGAIDDRPRILI